MTITLLGRAAREARRRRRLEPAVTAPAPAGPALRVLTLNIAHARRQAQHQALLKVPTLRRNLAAIAAVLGRERPDLVALQEADGPSAWSGGFDHVETLARLAGFEHAFRGEHNPFSLGRLDLSSGTALLSRLPLEATSSLAFHQNWRDTKGFVTATVAPDALGGLPIDVVSIHLDFLAERVRRRQVEQLVDRFAGSGRPLVVLGDFNCEWGERKRSLEMLQHELRLRPFEQGAAATFPAWRPMARLDWILISPELEFVRYRTLADRLSDHLGVIAEMRLRGDAVAASDAAPRSVARRATRR
jgi:endonuclease/exonuclease/phosphatase family metal-dependent hydrolase